MNFFFIYHGYGWAVLLILGASYGGIDAILKALNVASKTGGDLSAALASIGASIPCWFLGRYLLGSQATVKDKETGQKVKLPQPYHALFWIPMHWWAPIFIAVGVGILISDARKAAADGRSQAVASGAQRVSSTSASISPPPAKRGQDVAYASELPPNRATKTGVEDFGSPREIAKKSFPSVVLLAMQDEHGQPVSLGSGFFVKEDIIASNVHVVEKAANGYAKRMGENQRYRVAGVVAADLDHDLVLLAVEAVPGTPLKIADSTKVEVGDAVFVIGNPQGLEGTFSQGIISAVRDVGGEGLLQLTAPISPGSSGGPVLDARGAVIGVAVATLKSGQNLNFAVPSQYLITLIQKVGKPIPLASKQTKSRASAIDKFGGKLTEGVTAKNLELGGTSLITAGGRAGENPFRQEFRYTIANQLDIPVKRVSGLVIFYDTDGGPVDFQEFCYPDVIPPHLAKRLMGSADGSIFHGKIQYLFRIMNFELADWELAFSGRQWGCTHPFH